MHCAVCAGSKALLALSATTTAASTARSATWPPTATPLHKPLQKTVIPRSCATASPAARMSCAKAFSYAFFRNPAPTAFSTRNAQPVMRPDRSPVSIPSACISVHLRQIPFRPCAPHPTQGRTAIIRPDSQQPMNPTIQLKQDASLRPVIRISVPHPKAGASRECRQPPDRRIAPRGCRTTAGQNGRAAASAPASRQRRSRLTRVPSAAALTPRRSPHPASAPPACFRPLSPLDRRPLPG